MMVSRCRVAPQLVAALIAGVLILGAVSPAPAESDDSYLLTVLSATLWPPNQYGIRPVTILAKNDTPRVLERVQTYAEYYNESTLLASQGSWGGMISAVGPGEIVAIRDSAPDAATAVGSVLASGSGSSRAPNRQFRINSVKWGEWHEGYRFLNVSVTNLNRNRATDVKFQAICLPEVGRYYAFDGPTFPQSVEAGETAIINQIQHVSDPRCEDPQVVIDATSPPTVPLRTLDAATVSVGSQLYTGRALTPEVKVTLGNEVLRRGVDYSVTYRSNIEAGTGKVLISGIGNFIGDASGNFTITPARISDAHIAVPVRLAWTRKALRPSVAVKYGAVLLRPGLDYELGYKKNRSVGEATVQIVGKGNFTGEHRARFTILPRSERVIRIKSMRGRAVVRWRAAPEAEKAVSYRYAYRAKGSKKWKIKTATAPSSGATLKKLRVGKRYQVRVRVIVKASGRKYRSTWSAIKTSAKVK